MTGSHHTYDRIVWGSQDKSHPAATPRISKPVHAELGCVTPYLIVPGDAPWTAREIQDQAEALAAYKLLNSSHICASPQVLVTCRHWPQRAEFLSALRDRLNGAPVVNCFYPNSEQTYQRHSGPPG